MTTTWFCLALTASLVVLVAATQTPVRAQAGGDPNLTYPYAAAPPLGIFFDRLGPEPVFLDRPITGRELRLFHHGLLRIPRDRPFTFDQTTPRTVGHSPGSIHRARP